MRSFWFQMPKYKITNLIGFFLVTISIFLSVKGYFSVWVPIVVVVIWNFILLLGAFVIRLGFYLQVFTKIKNEKPYVAISFDDGPDVNTPALLDILKKHNAKATFFVKGANVVSNAKLLLRMKSEGHTIGNHTFSHSNMFPFFSKEKIIEEIQNCSKTIKEITGDEPWCFRPPFGITNPNISKAIKQSGLICIGWSVRSLDTIKYNPDKVISKVKRKIKPGSILLLHDTTSEAKYILEQILDHCKLCGFQPVQIDKLLLNNVNDEN